MSSLRALELDPDFSRTGPDEGGGGTTRGGGPDGVSLPLRLYGSKHTHRLLPARLALPLAAAAGLAVRERRNPAERRDVEVFMRDLLLHTPRAAEADALAERWLAERSRLRELFWRPWLRVTPPTENLCEVFGGGRSNERHLTIAQK